MRALTFALTIALAIASAIVPVPANASPHHLAHAKDIGPASWQQGTPEVRTAPHGATISAEVDRYITQQMHQQRIPGLSLAVVLDGRVIKAQGYGYADLEFRAPVTTDTLFESGSIGKQFTATAVMMLVEEGKVGLDDPITRYFPNAPASWSEITVRELLSHQSGIKDYTDVVNLRQDYTEGQLLALAESLPLGFSPGSDWAYSNTNYVLLGILIHKVTGEFYGDFLHRRIFGPLGMKTRIISESDIIPNRAAGYQLVKGQWKNQDWVSPSLDTTADGSLLFTALDLAKWDAALYKTQLLTRSSLNEMWTIQEQQSGPNVGKPNKGDYGFGWFIHAMNGHKLIEHTGAWQGFTDDISRYVDDKLTVIVLTNLDSTHSRPARIAHGVAGFYMPALKPPPPPKPIPDTEPQVAAKLRSVIAQIAAGTLDLSQFTPEQQKKFGAGTQKTARDFLVNEGTLVKLELLIRTQQNGESVSKYRAHFQYGTVVVLTLRLSGDGKIAGFSFAGD